MILSLVMNRKETWVRLAGLGEVAGEMPDAGWELNCANLAGANLAGANLSESLLSKANLAGANLSGANLSFADAYGAILVGANLAGANLSEANLAGANLSGANLSGANLAGANLSGANLAGATLNKADLFASNFKKADLKNVNLREATVVDADFGQADLSGSDITASVVSGVSTTGWIIDEIRADYIYFCRFDEENKEKSRRNFEKGQFELLFKCFPIVELIFEERLSVSKLFALMALIEKKRRQFPELGISLERVVKSRLKTRVSVRVNQDVNLSETARLIQDGVSESVCGAPDEALTPFLSQVLMPNFSEARRKMIGRRPLSIIEEIVPPTFQLIKADGTLFGVIS